MAKVDFVMPLKNSLGNQKEVKKVKRKGETFKRNLMPAYCAGTIILLVFTILAGPLFS